MQGLEALNEFKSFVSKLGGLGRYEDTYMVHAAEGETVVPMEVLDRDPLLKKRLFQSMVEMGIEPGRYIVGNELNSRNPVTGQPEFFLKKIVSQIRKAIPGDLENYLGPIVGLATGSLPLGAIAGAIGSGVPGAITGGGAGYFSPGLSMFGGEAGGLMELLRGEASRKLFEGPGGVIGRSKPTRGLFGFGGKFGLGEGTIGEAFNKYMGFGDSKGKSSTFEEYVKDKYGKSIDKLEDFEKEGLFKRFLDTADRDDKISLQQLLKAGVPLTIALGMLIDKTTPEGNVGPQVSPYVPTGESYEGILNPKLQFATDMPLYPAMAEGGVLDLQDGGESVGPGTGTSDSIPAMLSDGEFVMTAKAVRGAGGGDRREGAKRMYQLMENLESGGDLSRQSRGLEARA